MVQTYQGLLWYRHTRVMVTVSPADARHTLCTAHGFFQQKKGIKGTLEVCRKQPCIQSDPIEVAGRNADLTLQSRVKDYRQEYLSQLLYKTRDLFEYHCKMLSILPMELYPVFAWLRNRLSKRHAPFFKEHEKETALILKMLEDGPVNSRDFKGWKKVSWWGSTALSRVILERLWSSGKVMIHHRDGSVKYYALTEDVIPNNISGLPDETCVKEMVNTIVRASRIVSPSRAPEQWYAVGKTKKVRELLKILEKEGSIFSINLDGFRGPVYAPVEDKKMWEDPAPPDTDYVRFLAPLDPLNWNRALFNAIYEMEYSWEVYKKAEDRKYGYYCLPVLFNGDYVGLIEPFYRKKEKILEVRSLHILKSVDKRFERAFEEELARFCENLGAKTVEMK
jgi:uncharacterized protein YcaQ